jgi:lysophospholipase L1-like esterase
VLPAVACAEPRGYEMRTDSRTGGHSWARATRPILHVFGAIQRISLHRGVFRCLNGQARDPSLEEGSTTSPQPGDTNGNRSLGFSWNHSLVHAHAKEARAEAEEALRRPSGSFATIKLVAKGIYLALGDSISIDDYTGVPGGGAASQLARRIGFDLVDLTRDGNTTQGVLADLARAPTSADVVTLTAGGNDLLGGESPRAILRRLDQITQRLQPLGGRTVVNTVYDPSDGDNAVGRRELGLSRLATVELRRRLNALNGGIAKLARERGLLLADLERLCHGHGLASDEPWFVQVIEPNLAAATAIAEHWHELLSS